MDLDEEQRERSRFAGDASIGHLVKEITEDLSSLVRKEVELARNEISEILKTKARGAALLVIAAMIAVLILPFALISLIEVLAIWMPRWGASLTVTGLMVLLGLIAILIARSQLRSKTMPEETIASLKEDVEWAKNLRK